MKAKRLEFAKSHQHWTTEHWSKVLFSNESTIQLFGTGKQNVRRPPRKRYDKKYTVSTMKHPPNQMIWEAMSCNGTAGLYFLPSGKTMNSQNYLELLNNKLKTHMDIYDCNIFMHGGAPCCTSQKLCRRF